MTKQEIIALVSVNTGVSTADTRVIIEDLFETLKKQVIKGEMITVRGFGTFTKKHRAEKLGRNINKGTSLIVPAHDIPYFRPAAEFSDAVK